MINQQGGNLKFNKYNLFATSIWYLFDRENLQVYHMCIKLSFLAVHITIINVTLLKADLGEKGRKLEGNRP